MKYLVLLTAVTFSVWYSIAPSARSYRAEQAVTWETIPYSDKDYELDESEIEYLREILKKRGIQ